MWRHEIFFRHGFHLLGDVFWIALLLVLTVLLVQWLLRQPRTFNDGPTWMPPHTPLGPPPAPQPPLSAMEILRQRYARGEIDTATFEQMRERLGVSATPSE